RSPRRCSSRSSSATRRAPSPAPSSASSAASSSPTAAPCFSTRSATSRRPCRPSCCASCRSASSSVSATNKDLAKEVAEGRFREDLYYRLQVVPITISPLRERKGDIPLLVEHFLRRLAPKTNPRVGAIDDAALSRLIAYRWPGNVRELENVIEQSLVFSDGERLSAEALPAALRGDADSAPRTESSAGGGGDRLPVPSGEMALPDLLDDLERQLILK